MRPVILWFRRNLRLADNIALNAAVGSGRPIIPLYIAGGDDLGQASRWWLHHSLIDLDRSLRQLGASLVLRSGPPSEVIAELSAETGAEALYYTRRYEPASRRHEQEVRTFLGERMTIEDFDDSFLHSPDTIMTQAGSPYRVFTAFWKTASAVGEPGLPLPPPAALNPVDPQPRSLSIDDLALLSISAERARGYKEAWKPGEAAGLQRLDTSNRFSKIMRDAATDPTSTQHPGCRLI